MTTTKKTKILHTLFRVGSGGVEQLRLSLVRTLDPDRYEQRILCLDAFGDLPGQLEDAGCAVEVIGRGLSIFSAAPHRDALRVIRDWRPDIVHGAVYEGVAIAAVAGRLGRAPVVLGEETSDPVNRSLAGHALYRLLAGMSHHMLAVSPVVERYLTGTLRLPARKVSLVVNGVPVPPPPAPGRAAAIRASHGIAAGAFVIGTVCRLVDEHKRVSDLIRAMPAIAAGCRDPHLLVVGDGEDRAMLETLAGQLGVAARVHFCGYQAVPADFYPAMDVFALASAHEAFGLVLVEAMHAGLPVVATRVGGIPWVVEHGATGLLVDSGSPAMLASCLLELHASPASRRAMGQRGRLRALSEFGEDRYVRDIDSLYMKLLDRAGRA